MQLVSMTATTWAVVYADVKTHREFVRFVDLSLVDPDLLVCVSYAVESSWGSVQEEGEVTVAAVVWVVLSLGGETRVVAGRRLVAGLMDVAVVSTSFSPFA